MARFCGFTGPSGWKPWCGFLLRAGQGPGSRFGDQWLLLTRRRSIAARPYRPAQQAYEPVLGRLPPLKRERKAGVSDPVTGELVQFPRLTHPRAGLSHAEWRALSPGAKIERLLGMSLDRAAEIMSWPLAECDPPRLAVKMQATRVVFTICFKSECRVAGTPDGFSGHMRLVPRTYPTPTPPRERRTIGLSRPAIPPSKARSVGGPLVRLATETRRCRWCRSWSPDRCCRPTCRP